MTGHSRSLKRWWDVLIRWHPRTVPSGAQGRAGRVHLSFPAHHSLTRAAPTAPLTVLRRRQLRDQADHEPHPPLREEAGCGGGWGALFLRGGCHWVGFSIDLSYHVFSLIVQSSCHHQWCELIPHLCNVDGISISENLVADPVWLLGWLARTTVIVVIGIGDEPCCFGYRKCRWGM